MFEIEIKAAGVTFRPGYPDTLFELYKGMELELRADPRNAYDVNAVEILRADTGEILGYVPKEQAHYVSQALQHGLEFSLEWCLSAHPDYPQQPGLRIRLNRKT